MKFKNSKRLVLNFLFGLMICLLGPPVSFASKLSNDELIILNKEIQKCWSPSLVSPYSIITVIVDFDRSGEVLDIWSDTILASKDENFRAHLFAVERALYQCAPYSKVLKEEHYEKWKTLSFRFDPSFLGETTQDQHNLIMDYSLNQICRFGSNKVFSNEVKRRGQTCDKNESSTQVATSSSGSSSQSNANTSTELEENKIKVDEWTSRYRGKSVEFINLPMRLCHDYIDDEYECIDWSLRGGIYFAYIWSSETIEEKIEIYFLLPFKRYDKNAVNYISFYIDRDELFCRIDEIRKAEDWIEIALKNNVDLNKAITREHIGCYVYPNLIVANTKGFNRPKLGFNFFTTEPDYDGTIWIQYEEFLEYSEFIFNSIGDLAEEAKKIIDAEIETDNLFN